MRPPICAICHKDFYDDVEVFGLHFVLNEEDKAYNARMDEEGFCGHPAGYEWFCKAHIGVARQFVHLSLLEAMPLIRERISDESINEDEQK